MNTSLPSIRRRMKIHVPLWAVLWCLVTPGVFWAQTRDQSAGADPGLTMAADSDVEVQLIELDVRVTDRRGESVKGLSASDFVLHVDGEAYPVEHFAASEPGPELHGDSSVSTAERNWPPLEGVAETELGGQDHPRYLIVYLDQRFLGAAELASARTALLRFLRNDVPAGTRVMLASADQQLRIVQEFTHEPALVADALVTLEIDDSGGLWRTQYDATMREIQRIGDMGITSHSDPRGRSQLTFAAATIEPDEAEGGQAPGGAFLNQDEDLGRGELITTDPRSTLQMIQSFGQSLEEGLRASADHLSRLVSGASGLPGETSVLYVGGTLPVNATKTLFELWQETYGEIADGGDLTSLQASNRSWRLGVASSTLESGRRFSQAIDRLGHVADAASASGVIFNTLDISTPVRLGRAIGDVENQRSGSALRGGGQSTDTRLATRSDAGAMLLADRTGGRSSANRNFETFFDGIAVDLASSYTLAFRVRPGDLGISESEARGKLHEVGVELTRAAKQQLREAGHRGLQIQHRRKITVKTLDQEQVDRTVSALTMKLEAINPLEIEVLAGSPQEVEGGEIRVPLSVKVPMSKLALIPDRQAHSGRLSIYIALGGLGSRVRLEKAVVPVRIPNRDLLTAFGRSVDYRLEVTSPASAERIAVTVRDDYRPARSTVTAQFGTWQEGAAASVGDDSDDEAEGLR
ncbi:MAG: VWA domain-containing protein [Thermoanaerobaculia bacterium]|nr:VWA domain-containing protein [Thermoanaerobaculia bacterium]